MLQKHKDIMYNPFFSRQGRGPAERKVSRGTRTVGRSPSNGRKVEDEGLNGLRKQPAQRAGGRRDLASKERWADSV